MMNILFFFLGGNRTTARIKLSGLRYYVKEYEITTQTQLVMKPVLGPQRDFIEIE